MKKMKNNNIKVAPLDSDIIITKYARTIEKVDKPLRKMAKIDFLIVGTVFPITIILSILIIAGFTWLLPVLAIFVGGFGIFSIAYSAMMDTKVNSSIKRKIENNEISLDDVMDNDKYDDLLLSEELGVDISLNFEENDFNIDDYYTDEYKDYIKNYEPTADDNRNIELVNSDYYLSLEEVKEKLVKEMDIYYTVYKLPPLTITNKEWDLIIDELYNCFEKKDKLKFFSKYMSLFLRNIFVISIVDNSKTIGYEEFIKSLEPMFDTNIFDDVFSKRELNNIKKRLLLKVKEVVNLTKGENTLKKVKVVKLEEYRNYLKKYNNVIENKSNLKKAKIIDFNEYKNNINKK